MKTGQLRLCIKCGAAMPLINAAFWATGDAEFVDQMVYMYCPKCGEGQAVRMAHQSWQDGVQVVTETASDAEMVRSMVLQLFAQGASTDEVAGQIEQIAPAYKQFAQWLRENPWFATLSAAAIASVLTVLLTFLINRPQASKTEINNIIVDQTTTVTQTVSAPNPSTPKQPNQPPSGTP